MNPLSPESSLHTEEDLAPAAPALVVFDTSDPTRSPTGHQQTWKERQRTLDRLLKPNFTPRQMSRAQRRKDGDFRTAKQIIAEDIANQGRK